MNSKLDLIRNFSIIAHVDHGKTTLSDRLIQECGGLEAREMTDCVLDNLDVEKERGITVKAQAVSLNYKAKDGNTYQLNFIDTPGHVDFSYEVSRSLYACEGALLVVDASQGVEAQSVANCYKAIEQNLEILPVLNKIDLPHANPEKVKTEIEEIIGIPTEHAVEVSAKMGIGTVDLLEALVKNIPPPKGNAENPLQALIIDSWFDSYLGVVSLVRIKEGVLRVGEQILVKSTGETYKVDSVGVFNPKRLEKKELSVGEVGFLITGVKNIHSAPVGDTIVSSKLKDTPALPGFAKIKPMVYAAIFPMDSDDFEFFRESLEKLTLNDASLSYEPEVSDALGNGFRCGFLGLLHMEIIQERLEKEYKLDLIATPPNVVYEIEMKNGEIKKISNPTELPDPSRVVEIREPMATVSILTPVEYIGNVISLCIEKRGIQKNIIYTSNQVNLEFEIPMNEIILDFFDRLKSVSRGYASCDFSLKEFKPSDVVKLDVLINGEAVDSLSSIVFREEARSRGIYLLDKMQDLIPRQMFEVALQAAIGNKILARNTIKAMRKNVLAKCYGGDISRKKKLLEKQKEGKKRMKRLGNIELPKEVFMSVLNIKNR